MVLLKFRNKNRIDSEVTKPFKTLPNIFEMTKFRGAGVLHQIFGTRVQHAKKIGPNWI